MSDDSNILTLLAQVLKHLEKEHNSPPDKTAVQRYPSGVISVDINDKPLKWFFDEYEFVDWIRYEVGRLNNDSKN